MNKQKRLFRMNLLIVVILAFGYSSNCFSQHDIYLQSPNSIPSYCQETDIWCGAATTQMILEGYPGGVEHAFSQTDVWNSIQTHKNDAAVSWASDPDGVKGALMELGAGAGVNWVIFANANSESLMYSVAYWMNQRQYPVATLVWGFQHWIMIDGISTDVDPITNPTVTLQQIEIINPWNPPCATASHGGVTSLMTGTNWFDNYWTGPGLYPASIWNGNYIAVIEPPTAKGVVKITERQKDRGKIINPDEAVKRAVTWFKEFHVEKQKKYIALKNTKPLKPLLTNEKLKGYYLVPFGYEEGQIAQGAVLINAYTGDFQEVGVFEKPFMYLQKEDAAKLALKHFCLCDDVKILPKIKMELIFQPSKQTQSRFWPIWKATYNKLVVYITIDGSIFDHLIPLPPGD